MNKLRVTLNPSHRLTHRLMEIARPGGPEVYLTRGCFSVFRLYAVRPKLQRIYYPDTCPTVYDGPPPHVTSFTEGEVASIAKLVALPKEGERKMITIRRVR